MRPLIRATVIGAVLLGGCSIDAGPVRVGPSPICDTTNRGTLLLMAQAVPTAELIPCLNTLPEGWVIERVDIESGFATLSLDNPGVGDVVVTLRPECDPEGTPLATDLVGAQEYLRSGSRTDTRSIVFTGGCVMIAAPPRVAASEMTDEISFVTRRALAEASDLDL